MGIILRKSGIKFRFRSSEKKTKCYKNENLTIIEIHAKIDYLKIITQSSWYSNTKNFTAKNFIC